MRGNYDKYQGNCANISKILGSVRPFHIREIIRTLILEHTISHVVQPESKY